MEENRLSQGSWSFLVYPLEAIALRVEAIASSLEALLLELNETWNIPEPCPVQCHS